MNFENNCREVENAITNITRTKSKKNQRISPLQKKMHKKKSKIRNVVLRDNNQKMIIVYRM